MPLLEEELNVKRVELGVSEGDVCRIEPRLDRKVSGPLFKGQLPAVQAALAAEPVEQVAAAVGSGRELRLEVGGETVLVPPEAVVLDRHPHGGWAMSMGNGFVVGLDTRLTDDLLTEGRARAWSAGIQDLRKELDFDIGDRIRITYEAPDGVAGLFEAYRDYVAEETLATEIRRAETRPPEARELTLGDDRLAVHLEPAG